MDEAEAREMAEGRGGRALALARRFANEENLLLLRFDDAEQAAFLDIAWQELAGKTRSLTAGRVRTLGATAETIIERFGTFAALVEADPAEELDPSWFSECARIEAEGFDWTKWARPWLVAAIPADSGSSTTQWYIWEGVHSTIVLAVGLVRGSIEWRPLEAVATLERP